ncbi:MAG: hypothetical protein BGP00_00725 [Novosphingobium sp. 63-713]|uniref:hypothetical protein n=1 Tax=Novosphingobium sp. 63-713 TaxID=1895900 RepID=UPI00095F64CA|nr:hypothetical protein [Novosphingobium sp. 63-713]OJX87965.1 MAG: hypothetical protein BGP00_00725 [Novosphingobium sp. 63-713]
MILSELVASIERGTPTMAQNCRQRRGQHLSAHNEIGMTQPLTHNPDQHLIWTDTFYFNLFDSEGATAFPHGRRGNIHMRPSIHFHARHSNLGTKPAG